MNTPTAIVLAVVVALLALAMRHLIKKPACACANESACAGCASCGPMDAVGAQESCSCGCGYEPSAHE